MPFLPKSFILNYYLLLIRGIKTWQRKMEKMEKLITMRL